MVFVRPDSVYLQSRRAEDLTPYFPDVVAAVRESLPPGTVADGEMVVWDTAMGRTTFPALLGRITAGRRLAREAAARPANLVLFDVLADAGDVLTGRPLRQRRVRLERLLADAPPALALCPQTSDVTLARTWFDELAVTGSEGPGREGPGRDLLDWRPGPGLVEVQRRVTAEAVIGGVIGSVDDPRVLLLGRLDGRGRLRYIGRTVPLALSQRQDLGRMLTPAPDGHPWPQPLPATWIGQLDRREPQPYVQVKPLLVAEIVVDQAYDRGRHRHPIHHLRLRADLSPADVEPWQP